MPSSVAICSDGDSFYLDASWTWDGLTTFDGCYSDSGSTLNDEAVYFRGGDKVDGEPAVILTDGYGTGVS